MICGVITTLRSFNISNGKSPCSIENTSFKGSIFQPAMLAYWRVARINSNLLTLVIFKCHKCLALQAASSHHLASLAAAMFTALGVSTLAAKPAATLDL